MDLAATSAQARQRQESLRIVDSLAHLWRNVRPTKFHPVVPSLAAPD